LLAIGQIRIQYGLDASVYGIHRVFVAHLADPTAKNPSQQWANKSHVADGNDTYYAALSEMPVARFDCAIGSE
jgi:hypothetical protein